MFPGVYFHANLTWENQLLSVCKKMYKFLSLFGKYRKTLDTFTFGIFHNVLVFISLIPCITARVRAGPNYMPRNKFVVYKTFILNN